MKIDTPLNEVAEFLPKEAADVLLQAHVEVQTAVLTDLRHFMVYLEQKKCRLDPIQQDVIFHQLCIQLAGAYSNAFLKGVALLKIQEYIKEVMG